MVWIDLGIFILGAVVGSFLNVCIHRIPAGCSIVFPSSRCPKCGHPISWHDNIPLLGYLLLKGHCRHCGEGISPQYPLVEGLTACLALSLYWKFGAGLQGPVAFAFVCALIVVTFIDLKHQIIPHAITLPGIPLCFLASVFVMDLRAIDAFMGVMTGIGVLYLIAVYYEAITGNEGMGGGDVNLLAMMGAFLGWQSLLPILFVAAFVGAVVGVILVVRHGRDLKYAVPFGPFLALGAVVYLFAGPFLLRFWYERS